MKPLAALVPFAAAFAVSAAGTAALAQPGSTPAAAAPSSGGGQVHQQGSPAEERLPSGVVVRHVKPGSGPKPSSSDVVRVHYRGTLADGTEFDSSFKRGQPASFPLGGVVPCWTQGVARMQVGGTAQLTCPPETAYGARGVPGVIPPNSTLTFEVQLLGIGR